MALKVRQSASGNLDLFSGKAPSQSQDNLDLFANNAPQKNKGTTFQDVIDYGPMARGVQLAERGVKAQDAPYIASKMLSGRLMGIPEMVAKNPIGAFTQLGANIPDYFGNKGQGRQISRFSMMPKPATEAGKRAGEELGLLSGLVPAAEMTSALPAFGMARRFKKATSLSKKGQDLSKKLLSDAEQARKTVGARYDQYLQQFGDDVIDANKTTELFQKMPKALIEEVKNNPLIEKEVNRLGQVIIKPTLRNAKHIRDIVRGDVSSKYWNAELVEEPERKAANFIYENLGKIMREGRPDLKNIMAEYSQIRGAGKELFNSLMSRSGNVKSRPITSIFKKGADTAKQEAVNTIVKFNPAAAKTRDLMIKAAKSEQLRKGITKAGSALIPIGAGLLGIERISRKF